jgi:hypothetical protein
MIDGPEISVDERAITLDFTVSVWQAETRCGSVICEAMRRAAATPRAYRALPSMRPRNQNGGRGPFFEPRAAARGRDPQ